MAEFEMEFPEGFLEKLLQTDFDEICEEALYSSAHILVENIKKSAKEVIEHSGESELIESFGQRKVTKAKNGVWIVNVTPSGYSALKKYTAKNKAGTVTNRKYPVPNTLKAIWKEYGIPGQQAPRPFLKNGINNAKKEVLESIQKTYEKKVGGNGFK